MLVLRNEAEEGQKGDKGRRPEDLLFEYVQTVISGARRTEYLHQARVSKVLNARESSAGTPHQSGHLDTLPVGRNYSSSIPRLGVHRHIDDHARARAPPFRAQVPL